MTNKLPVDLSGAPLTMLATLYAKALDADLPKSILHDTHARDAVARLDYDWARTTITAARSPAVTTRTAHFDHWTRQFLAVHPEAVVLHVGCGLDSRYLRLTPGAGVDWYDIDYPAVSALRAQIFPSPPKHHIVAASVTDPAWLSDIPADRPTLLLGEGLTMYLTAADGLGLLRRVVDRFPSGEIQFDAFSRFGISTQWSNAVVRRSGATLHWGINRPSDIVAAVPGLRLLAWLSPFETDSFREVSAPFRALAVLMSAFSATKYMAQYHRYAF